MTNPDLDNSNKSRPLTPEEVFLARGPLESLTPQEAFLAMSDFVWQFARTADISTIFGDILVDPDGSPRDPAVWGDWLESIQWIRDHKAPRTEVD